MYRCRPIVVPRTTPQRPESLNVSRAHGLRHRRLLFALGFLRTCPSSATMRFHWALNNGPAVFFAFLPLSAAETVSVAVSPAMVWYVVKTTCGQRRSSHQSTENIAHIILLKSGRSDALALAVVCIRCKTAERDMVLDLLLPVAQD